MHIIQPQNNGKLRVKVGFQLLPGRLGPFFVNLLGRFYPPYMPGGGGPFDDIEITLLWSSKLFLSGEVKRVR